ncbi:hypothetical protein [Roseomonas sp. WA12]
MPASMPQLVSVQYLRAVATLIVVVCHARLHLDRLGLPAAGTDWLASGVDVFFVISRLIIWVFTAVLPAGTLAF